jgi:hypothetical protein
LQGPDTMCVHQLVYRECFWCCWRIG